MNYQKTDRTRLPRFPVLAEPVEVAEWKKNRGGDTIKVTLKSYEGFNLVDIRTWFGEDGYRKPGKGFAAGMRHLPKLAVAINQALAEAQRLGVIAGEALADEAGQP